MPAVTVEDLLVLPRLPRPDATPIRHLVTAPQQREGAGLGVRRPFPGAALPRADPFLLLDHVGETVYQPYEARAPLPRCANCSSYGATTRLGRGMSLASTATRTPGALAAQRRAGVGRRVRRAREQRVCELCAAAFVGQPPFTWPPWNPRQTTCQATTRRHFPATWQRSG
jgi:hypothetical protein